MAIGWESEETEEWNGNFRSIPGNEGMPLSATGRFPTGISYLGTKRYHEYGIDAHGGSRRDEIKLPRDSTRQNVPGTGYDGHTTTTFGGLV